jgi:translation initiation factor 1
VAVEKRKRGKTVTVVRGLAPEADTLADLLTQLKNLCGAGGTLKQGDLEIQGSHLQRVRDALRDRGYRVQG